MIKGYSIPSYQAMGRFPLPTAVITVGSVTINPNTQDFQKDGAMIKASAVAYVSFNIYETEDGIGGNPLDTIGLIVADTDGATEYTAAFGTCDPVAGAFNALRASTDYAALMSDAVMLS